MARFSPSPPPKPISINQFLGVNESIGQTGLKPGEALRQVNYRITQDYKPQKRQGHNTWWDFGNNKDVQGTWNGVIGGNNVMIACNDGKVYERDMTSSTTKTLNSELITDGVVAEIGTITDAKTSILYFQSKLLFINGTDFKEYDGTTYQDVVPYVPTIYFALKPDMTGTTVANDGEQVNLITGRKKAEYQGNGTATAYQLPETSLDAATITCTVDGVTKVEGVDFTVNRTTGIATFGVAPANASLVIFSWTKVISGYADLVKKNKYCMTFGPDNDTSIFLWGNPSQKNRRSWCASLNAGYWPVGYFTNVGTNEFAITDIKTNNAGYQIIFKENMAHYSYAEYVEFTETYDYPVKDLRDDVGNIVFNGVQICNNTPISVYKQSWWEWSSTTIQNEKNSDVISQRLKTSLSAIDLSTAVTFDYQSEKEYWCNVGSMVYIWNYGNNTMYTFDNIGGTCYLDIDGVVYYGSQGTIEKMEGFNDNGIVIISQLDTGFNSFGGMNLLKSSDIIHVGLLPDAKTSLTIYFRTNKITEFKQIRKKAKYNLLDFNYYDFNNYTFLTNRNPQPFPLEFSSNDYVYIQFRLENKELDETCTVLELLIGAEVQGEV